MRMTRSEVKRLFAFTTEIWRKKVYLLLFSVSIAHIGSGVLLGFIPTLSTHYFASALEDGGGFDCVNQPEGEEPDRTCKEAHTMAVCWDAGKLFLTNLFLSIVVNAVVQRYSTVYGRKPFIVLGLISALIPPTIVLLHLQADLPFFWFYLAKAFELSFAMPALCNRYVMDVVEESAADMVYVVYLFAVSLSTSIGLVFSVVGVLEDTLHAVITSLALISFSVIVMLLFVPESVSISTRLSGLLSTDDGHVDVGRSWFNLWIRPFQEMYASFRLPVQNEGLFSITVVYLILELINIRDSELELQYLQEVAGFGTEEQSTFLMIRSLVSSFVYVALFPLWGLLFVRTYKDAFGLGFVVATVKLFGMIFVQSSSLAYILEGCGAVDAIVSLMIYRVLDHRGQESGSVRSAILGVRSIAQGLSPVFHAAVFALFRHTDVYLPGAPFISLSILAFAGLLALLNIRVEKYGLTVPTSTFLRLLTLTFYSDEADLDMCLNNPVSGRGYFSEEDTNNSSTTEAEDLSDSEQAEAVQARFD